MAGYGNSSYGGGRGGSNGYDYGRDSQSRGNYSSGYSNGYDNLRRRYCCEVGLSIDRRALTFERRHLFLFSYFLRVFAD